jgi:hypothetical protein
MPSYNIDSYSVRMWSSRSTTNLSPGTAVAGIYLYQGKTYRGYVYFFPDGTALAPPVFHSSTNQAFLHFNLSEFGPTVDLLRNEKPVFLYYFSPTNAGLFTGREPTGEEES